MLGDEEQSAGNSHPILAQGIYRAQLTKGVDGWRFT
jgi:hypothetical protein